MKCFLTFFLFCFTFKGFKTFQRYFVKCNFLFNDVFKCSLIVLRLLISTVFSWVNNHNITITFASPVQYCLKIAKKTRGKIKNTMLDLMQFGPTPSCRGVSREDQWHLLARALCSVHTSIKILIFKFVPVYRGPQVFFVSKRTNTHVHYCQTKISNKTLYSYLRSTTIR